MTITTILDPWEQESSTGASEATSTTTDKLQSTTTTSGVKVEGNFVESIWFKVVIGVIVLVFLIVLLSGFAGPPRTNFVHIPVVATGTTVVVLADDTILSLMYITRRAPVFFWRLLFPCPFSISPLLLSRHCASLAAGAPFFPLIGHAVLLRSHRRFFSQPVDNSCRQDDVPEEPGLARGHHHLAVLGHLVELFW